MCYPGGSWTQVLIQDTGIMRNKALKRLQTFPSPEQAVAPGLVLSFACL